MPRDARGAVPAEKKSARAKVVAGGLLTCPVRGLLKVSALAADGLTFTEERRRIDFVKFLLAKGYPADHIKIETNLLRFGHKGRNSFRTDVAVFDIPATDVPADVEKRKQHIRLVAEIKRDNANAVEAKATQVRPALDFVPDLSAHAIYWDDVEQRLFYKVQKGTKTQTLETAAALLPAWGHKLGNPVLTSGDLRATNIRTVFEKMQDRLHAEMPDKAARFEVMLQILLSKLYDEHTHRFPKSEMTIQDFTDAPASDAGVKAGMEKLLSKAADFYGKYLPKPVSKEIQISGGMLRSLTAIIAPVTIFGTRRAVLQDFYMYFAQHIYRWEMAQYFTPTEVVDFIVALVNPGAGDTVKDPACGSGDFLISALHYTHHKGVRLHDAIWGADNSKQAIQVCVLNMVLNGDGKSNLRVEDSLAVMPQQSATYSVVLCNPPFGVKIVEKNFEVLHQFELGHEWIRDEATGRLNKSEKVLKSQETGLLFAELCVRQTEPGGRIGLVMPNGYLGNSGLKYLAFRQWLLRHTKIVAVVGFPRFTFKKSGADVSASVLVLERRTDALDDAMDSEDYPFHAGLLETVGWSAGDNRAEAIYRRDPKTGDQVLDDQNEPILDADFDRALQDFRTSEAASAFSWAPEGARQDGPRGWSIRIRDVLARGDLAIDPKRWCPRCVQTREAVKATNHFRLGDVIEVIPEIGSRGLDPAAEYHYIEIQNMADGGSTPETMRGWQLPSRAKHGAVPGDIFVGSIWSSVGKWCIASGDCSSVRVTNGCHRLRIRHGKEDYLLDLLAGLSAETYRIQARAFCTGSDGLADLSPEDLREIVLPRLDDADARKTLKPIVDALLAGRLTVAATMKQLVRAGKAPALPVTPRSSHMVQV